MYLFLDANSGGSLVKVRLLFPSAISFDLVKKSNVIHVRGRYTSLLINTRLCDTKNPDPSRAEILIKLSSYAQIVTRSKVLGPVLGSNVMLLFSSKKKTLSLLL